MAKRRQVKSDHLIYADAVGSRGKSGVWFGEREEFKKRQTEVMDTIKERVDWVPLEGAMLAISADPPGIVVIAPNPSLPGVIVVADGATKANSEKLQEIYTAIVRQAVQDAGITTPAEEPAAAPASR